MRDIATARRNSWKGLSACVAVAAQAALAFSLPLDAEARSDGILAEDCRILTHRYPYRVRVVGTLEHAVSYRPDSRGSGMSGQWRFDDRYVTEVERAIVRVQLMRGNCAGQRFGMAEFAPPGGQLSYLGGTSIHFFYRSTVTPTYPPDDPRSREPPRRPCFYGISPSVLPSSVGLGQLLATWGPTGQHFGFGFVVEPGAATGFLRSIGDRHDLRCQEHASFRPSTVDLRRATAHGIRFRPPSSPVPDMLTEMRRGDIRRLDFPIDKLAVGRSFEADSGPQSQTTRRGRRRSEQTDWRVKVEFARLAG